MTRPAEDWSPLLPNEQIGQRILVLIRDRIGSLSPDDRQRVARAEVGSTELRRDPDGSIHVWIGIADPVYLGSFPLVALATNATPGDVN